MAEDDEQLVGDAGLSDDRVVDGYVAGAVGPQLRLQPVVLIALDPPACVAVVVDGVERDEPDEVRRCGQGDRVEGAAGGPEAVPCRQAGGVVVLYREVRLHEVAAVVVRRDRDRQQAVGEVGDVLATRVRLQLDGRAVGLPSRCGVVGDVRDNLMFEEGRVQRVVALDLAVVIAHRGIPRHAQPGRGVPAAGSGQEPRNGREPIGGPIVVVEIAALLQAVR